MSAAAKNAEKPVVKVTPKRAPIKGAVEGKSSKVDALGIMGGGMADLLKPSAKAGAVSDGKPLYISINLIDEDPDNPRTEDNPGFSKDSIEGMGVSIKARGIKTPLSLKDNPNVPGRFIINHGARRFRGAKIAELSVVPAFIDNDYTEDDQATENIAREGLTPREIAERINRALKRGLKKQDIAAIYGKSPSYISQHVALLDLPEPIAAAFNAARVSDVTLVNELVTAYKKHPDDVATWLSDENTEITRGSVKSFREYLENKGRDPNTVDAFSDKTDEEAGGDGQGPDAGGSEKKEKEADPTKLKKAIVQIEFDGQPARLLLNKRPTEIGLVWIKFDHDGQEFEDDITRCKLTAVIEA